MLSNLVFSTGRTASSSGLLRLASGISGSSRPALRLNLNLNLSQLRTMSWSSLIKNQAFVDGQWVDAKSGKTFAVTNPTNGKHLANVPDMDAEDTRKAIDAAYEAFQSFRETTAKERSNLLRKWFEVCSSHQQELAELLNAEQGKPVPEAAGEVAYGSSFFEWFSEEARRINGEVVPANAKNKQMVFLREPIGVAAMITPWNFPNAMITRKVGAALAAGCTCVIKPAEDTPLSALALMSLAEKAGIPKGVVNVVTCAHESAAEIGQVLCESEKVAAMSFTGSTRVGKILYRQCANTMKKLSLELGGNAPFIVFDAADLSLAVQGCMASKFRNAGQTCVCSNRMLVQANVYDEFVQRLKETVEKNMVVGDGTKKGVNQGPLINERQFQRVVSMVEDAVQKGANVVTGGKKHESGPLQYTPTILTEVAPGMTIYGEEIFGPVVQIIKFDTEEEAISIANETRMGLAGYFYSNDVRQCWRVAKKLELGMVGINEGLMSCPEGVFGGVKESGLGREGSHHGIDEYTETKYLCFGNL